MTAPSASDAPPQQHAPSYSTTSGYRRLEVHYRTEHIPYRLALHDMYIVPTAATSVGSASIRATLTSPLMRAAALTVAPPDTTAVLQYELHDLHCPNCTALHPISKRAAASAATSGGASSMLDVAAGGGGRHRSSSPSPQRPGGDHGGAASEPATMQRCAQCIVCPMCRSAVAHRRTFPDKAPTTPSSATTPAASAALSIDSGTVSIYCTACHWKTPPLPPPTLRSWLASSTHSVVRSACGYQPIVSALRHSYGPISLSNSARQAVTRDVSEGKVAFTTVRSEKVLQLDAALQTEVAQLHAQSGNPFWSEAQQFGTHRLVGQQVVQKTIDELLSSEAVVLPPPPPPPRTRTSDGDTTRSLRMESQGDTARALGGLILHAPSSSTIMFHSLEGGVLGTSASPQAVQPGTGIVITTTTTTEDEGKITASSAGGVSGEQQQHQQEQELRIVPMLRAPLMPRMNVVIAAPPSAGPQPSVTPQQLLEDTISGSGGAAPVVASAMHGHHGALVSASSSACDGADGFSGKFFTNGLSNPHLATSLCAARYVPVLMFPANLSRYAKADAAVTGGNMRRRLFVMLRLLNAEEVSSVTVQHIAVAGTEGCTATLSTPFQSAGGHAEASASITPTIVLRHRPPTAVPTGADTAAGSATPPAPTLSGVKYFVDNRICDEIFTPPTDDGAAPSTTAAVGYHVRQGSCMFGIEVTPSIPADSGDNNNTGEGPAASGGVVSIELEITVSIVSAVLHSALRRAFPLPAAAAGSEGVLVTYRAVLTCDAAA